MSIRNKLILMLAIPLAALAIVGALGFRSQSSTAQQASVALEDDAVVQGMNQAIKAIGAERIGFVQELPDEEIDLLRAETDARIAEALESAADANQAVVVEAALEDAAASVGSARSGNSLGVGVRAMNRATVGLREARNNVEVAYPSQATFAEAKSIDFAVDIADRQDALWLEYVASVAITPGFIDRMRTEIPATQELRDQIISIAPEEHVGPLNATLTSSSDSDIARSSILAVERFETGSAALLDETMIPIVVASHEDWYGHAVRLQQDVTADLAGLSDQAEDRQNLFALLGTLGLIVLFGLIYVVYRSVVRPLEDLLVGADEIATDRLPSVVAELRTIGSSDANVRLERLPKESDDELGALVDAFNDVQLTAFDLAVEQARSRRNIAEMFVNLGRRNQKLLQRMLSTISDLENDEKNPDKLEQLFQLDHMTTRMRRNAESLLVVAGTTTPRQWAKPVPAAEVVRSALAEVQDYHRVDILSLADAPMAGNAVADVTHLLAELLENSLQFSEPGTHVNISSRWKDGNYRIVINDQGFGMSPEELVEHNGLIADPPAPDQAPTRFLGLFVVGHLAKRHGIDVLLTDATIGGTDARISIPGSLMSEAAGSAEASAHNLPVRDMDDGLDLDAELAALTAETDLDFDAEELPALAEASDASVAAESFDSELGDLPVRGEMPAAAVEDLPAPASDSELDDLPMRGDVAVSAIDDLPVRDGAFMAELEGLATADAFQAQVEPLQAETAIDFGQVPEMPEYESAQASVDQLPAPPAPPAPAAPAAALATAQVATAPVAPAPAAPAPAAPAPRMAPAAAPVPGGLPQRTPRATLQSASTLPSTGAMPAPVAPTPVDEEEDVAATATNVGSMFSAFQSGVQRGERSTN